MSLQGSGGPEGPPRSESPQLSQLDRIVAWLGANEQVEMVGGFRFNMTDGEKGIVRRQHVVHIASKFSDIPTATPQQIGMAVRRLNQFAAALSRRLTHELPDVGEPQIRKAGGKRSARRGLRIPTLTFTGARDISDRSFRGRFHELLPPQLIIAIFPNRQTARDTFHAVADQKRVINNIPPISLFQPQI